MVFNHFLNQWEEVSALATFTLIIGDTDRLCCEEFTFEWVDKVGTVEKLQ